MSAVVLEKAFKVARKAWRADKEDKKLKKAFKAAKAAFEESKTAAPAPVVAADDSAKQSKKKDKGKKRKAEEAVEVEEPVKKPKVDIEALQKALKKAKKANKAAGKTPETKKALKAAKKALADAEASGSEEPVAVEEEAVEEEAEEEEEEAAEEEAVEDPLASLKKAKPVDPNADARLFCGNLSWDIDDDSIKDFFKDCGTINDVYWLEDRDTGKFKGCGFLTFDSVEMGIAAMELNGTECLGREIKLDYSPRNNAGKGSKGKGSKGKGKGGKGGGLSDKPDGCTTVFCGNLAYDIDDDKMGVFAKDAGCGEVKAIRWLTDRDSGEFKGCGFVEFWDTACVDSFVKKNGEDLLGRAIRIDYSKPREKSW